MSSGEMFINFRVKADFFVCILDVEGCGAPLILLFNTPEDVVGAGLLDVEDAAKSSKVMFINFRVKEGFFFLLVF